MLPVRVSSNSAESGVKPVQYEVSNISPDSPLPILIVQPVGVRLLSLEYASLSPETVDRGRLRLRSAVPDGVNVYERSRPAGVVVLVADSPSAVNKSPELLEPAPAPGAIRNSAEEGDN